jgi:serine/threonine-protein kinase RsbW
MSVVDKQVTLEFPGRAEYVVLGRLALTGLLRDEAGYSDECLADIKLALTEACTNSIRHACGEDSGVVRIYYQLHADRLVLGIGDPGDGPTELLETIEFVADPSSLPPDDGGMGMLIIKAVMDEVWMEHPAEGGTVLWLMKRHDA